MTKKMIMDALHPEEARVAILHDGELYDYDFVTTAKTQLKGNIFLAKITRVEPSLQAAFVEYGNGRQGFLAFSEIHPDYYQLPTDDKQKLLAEHIAEAEAEEAEEEAAFEREQQMREQRRFRSDEEGDEFQENFDAPEATETEDSAFTADASYAPLSSEHSGDHAVYADPLLTQEPAISDASIEVAPLHIEPGVSSFDQVADYAEPTPFADQDLAASAGDDITASDALNGQESTENSEGGEGSETSEGTEQGGRRRSGRPTAFYRRYRIQEVIKRHQIVLVQVTKEERGNKGCSLTTYISLAGRYCVLMPNSPKGGGISRKITDRETRKQLKELAADMRTHRGMSVIIRTAGIDQGTEDIKRDYEYLVKLWNKIREDTLASSAPAQIYEEGGLIKRAIRDLCTNDIETIEIEGSAAFDEALDFTTMLMPTRTNILQRYQGSTPIFTQYGVEEELEEMLEPQVKLPSGGYIVINPTEALISIDVNSGRSTTERNVEETALKTNVEAAREVARQMRLRDLAGLIVIDFIDMNYGKNRKVVERALRDAMKQDRAKIQLGRISMFGLMELSRQRMRPSMSEAMGVPCPHCRGTGIIHSVETVTMQIVRALQKEAAGGEYTAFEVAAPLEIALNLLNSKRTILSEMETRFGITISVIVDATIITASFKLSKTTPDGKVVMHDPARSGRRRGRRGGTGAARRSRTGRDQVGAENEAIESAPDTNTSDSGEDKIQDDERGERGARRGRRGGRGRRNDREPRENNTAGTQENSGSDVAAEAGAESGEGAPREKRERRGRRGGRNRRGERTERSDRPRAEDAAPATSGDGVVISFQTPDPQASSPRVVALEEVSRAAVSSGVRLEDTPDDPSKPKRKGWWSRVLEN